MYVLQTYKIPNIFLKTNFRWGSAHSSIACAHFPPLRLGASTQRIDLYCAYLLTYFNYFRSSSSKAWKKLDLKKLDRNNLSDQWLTQRSVPRTGRATVRCAMTQRAILPVTLATLTRDKGRASKSRDFVAGVTTV